MSVFSPVETRDSMDFHSAFVTRTKRPHFLSSEDLVNRLTDRRGAKSSSFQQIKSKQQYSSNLLRITNRYIVSHLISRITIRFPPKVFARPVYLAIASQSQS